MRGVWQALDDLERIETPGVAAFDADGVLWHGDVSEDFTRWMIGRGDFDGSLWDAYEKVNAGDPAAGCIAIVRFYAGMATADLTARVREFWDTGGERAWIEPTIGAVRRLSAGGIPVYVVSGTPRPVLDPLVEHLPVRAERILALELEIGADGRFTGRPRGVPTCGAGKAAALRAAGADPVCLAAGNSVLDIEMLRLSNHVRWAVDPDAALLKTATREGWLITDNKGKGRRKSP